MNYMLLKSILRILSLINSHTDWNLKQFGLEQFFCDNYTSISLLLLCVKLLAKYLSTLLIPVMKSLTAVIVFINAIRKKSADKKSTEKKNKKKKKKNPKN